MSNSNRGLIITIVVILIVFCLCMVGLAVGGAMVFLFRAGTTSSVVEVPPVIEVTPQPLASLTPIIERLPSATPASQAGTQVPPTIQAQITGQPSPAGSLEIPEDVLQSMLAIEEDVFDIRGLAPDESQFHRVLLSPAQLRQRVIDDFLEDYTPEEAQQDGVILSALGLLTPGYDILGLYRELLSEQVAGFYDDETKEMVVVQGQQFGGPERATYSHEYTHALQDQNYNFREGLGFDDDQCEEDTERCAAIQALIEGDATLTEENWLLNYSSIQDKQEILEFYSTYESPIFDGAPAFLQEDFLFPYIQGRQFVENFYNQSGWDGVDGLYAELPVSTEQILHPEKYPDDAPLPVTLPDLAGILGDGWEMIDDNVLGEWYTYLMLARGVNPTARVSDPEAAEAAEGWGGDRYVVYSNPGSDEAVLVLSSTWDSQSDAREFADQFRQYADLRFGEGTTSGSTTTWQSSTEYSLFTLDEAAAATLWVLAPDEATALAVAESVAEE